MEQSDNFKPGLDQIILIRSCSPAAKGSMPEFARLVEAALRDRDGFDVKTCDLFPPHARSMWRDHVWRFLHARRVLSRHSGELFHLLDASMAAFVPASLHSRMVATVHDLIPLLQLEGRLPGVPSVPAAWLIQRSVKALQGMQGFAADSACTLRDARTATGAHVPGVVMPLPVRLLPVSDDSQRVPFRYLLHVGHNARYKNRVGVLKAFECLADIPDLHLVMVGPPPSDECRCRARACGRVLFREQVSDVALGSLYRQAELLLFPSLYEGFGMPVLEAMAAGCPVVCSDGGSLPEVVGEAALIAPVGDIKGLAGHCRAVLADAGLRERLVAKGKAHADSFTMQRFSDSLVAWYQDILKIRRL